MPIYEFKCPKCKKVQEIIMSFSQMNNSSDTSQSKKANLTSEEEKIFKGCKTITREVPVGKCKKCDQSLFKSDQQINFAGYFNMNNSIKAKAYRKYSNKQGGPQAIVNGKVIGRRD